MKRLKAVIFFLIGAVFLLGGNVSAYTIDDNYIGGNPANPTYYGDDVIGNESVFQIHGMDVSVSSAGLTVDIYANYFDDILYNTSGLFGTAMGDLFISTNGYNPTNPSEDDYYGNGEVWEYALVLSNHLAAGGNLSLYEVTSENIQLSYIDIYGYYRNEQEVRIKTDQGGYVSGGGSFAINYFNDSNQYNDYLRFYISNDVVDWTQFDSLAFHWAPTCGNDVIEGATPVPEPATMILLGIGLMGMGTLGRKKIKK